MKKIIISALAISALLFTVSCEKEKEVDNENILKITNPAELTTAVTADKDVEITLSNDVAIPAGVTITAKSITLKGGVVDNNISLVAEDGITIDGIKVTGSKAENNAKININTKGNVVVKNATFNTTTSAYNGIEINLNSDVCKSVDIENCTFSEMQNNCINIFGMAEGGTINIKDCSFDLSSTPSNAVRLSNKTSAKNVTVNFTDCKYKYGEGESTQAFWYGFVLFQNYVKDLDKSIFNDWTINVKNVTNNGVKIDKANLNTNTSSQFACMYDDFSDPKIITDASLFPKFIFE
jgi:hypothetical protein